GMTRDAIAEVGNAADAAPFIAAREKVARDNDLALDDRPVVFAGRLIAAKNIDGLLRAMALLVDKEESAPLPRLVIAGDGAERVRLQRLARDLSVAERVDWLGETSPDRLADRLATARLLVLPSHSEPWGLVAN